MKYLCKCHGYPALHNFQEADKGSRITLGTWRCLFTNRKCKVVVEWQR